MLPHFFRNWMNPLTMIQKTSHKEAFYMDAYGRYMPDDDPLSPLQGADSPSLKEDSSQQESLLLLTHYLTDPVISFNCVIATAMKTLPLRVNSDFVFLLGFVRDRILTIHLTLTIQKYCFLPNQFFPTLVLIRTPFITNLKISLGAQHSSQYIFFIPKLLWSNI